MGCRRLQDHGVTRGPAGGIDHILDHRQQSGDPFSGQFQDAAIVEAGDDLAIQNPSRCHAPTFV